MTDIQTVKARLEYLRGELHEERISWGELLELQDLVEHIEPNDVELLEAAGVSEEDYLEGLEAAGVPAVRKTPKPGEIVVVSRLPKCDFCGEPARYDFRTGYGPWANGCEAHWDEHRAQSWRMLGVGIGQFLITPDEIEERTSA